MKPERPRRRALLVASIGVATVSYAMAGCGKSSPPGNLAQPLPVETAIVGNPGVLVDASPPEPAPVAADAGAVRKLPPGAESTPKPVIQKRPPTSGNLMAPE